MSRVIALCYFSTILLSLSVADNQKENIESKNRDVTDAGVNDRISSSTSMQPNKTESPSNDTLVTKMKSLLNTDVVKKLQKLFTNVESDGTELNNTIRTGSPPAANLTTEDEGSPGHEFDKLIYNVKNLLAKVQEIDTKMNSTMLNLTNQVATMGTEVKDLQTDFSNLKTLNRSHDKVMDKVDDIASLLRYSQVSKTSADGIIVGTDVGVFKIELKSLQQTQIFTGNVSSVSFDWNTKKVYWVEKGVGIKRTKLDGTGVEPLVQDPRASAVAVDSITANLYYRRSSSESFETIKVCTKDGGNCSVVAKAESGFYHIALYPSKGIMFWSTPSTTMRANMDGTDASVRVPERMVGIGVDEDSDRLYWGASSEENYIGSTDLFGKDRRVMPGLGKVITSVAVHVNTIYFADQDNRMVKSVSKDGGKVMVIGKITGKLPNIVLYGSKPRPQYNPCEQSGCSDLCVLKLDSFACLCPEGKTLDEDGRRCV